MRNRTVTSDVEIGVHEGLAFARWLPDGEPVVGAPADFDALRKRLTTHPERAAAERRILVADATIDLAQTRLHMLRADIHEPEGAVVS